MRTAYNYLAVLAAGIILAGCPAKKPALEIAPVNGKILIAELIIARSDLCPVCTRHLYPCPVEDSASELFSEALGETLIQKGFEIFRGKIPNPPTDQQAALKDYIALADKMRAKYLMLPVLYGFAERKGSALSASRPAQVGFHLHIYNVKDGKEIWGGDFHEKQQPLSENILELENFIRRGGKWLTADELAREGISRLLDRFLKTEKK